MWHVAVSLAPGGALLAWAQACRHSVHSRLCKILWGGWSAFILSFCTVTQASKRAGHFYWHCSVCAVRVRVCARVCLCELSTHSQKAVPGSRTVFNEGKGMASKSCNPIYMCRSTHTHTQSCTQHTPLLVGTNETEEFELTISRPGLVFWQCAS